MTTPIIKRGKRAFSDAETLPAGATGLGVGVRELEPARDHLARVIQYRALQVERRLGVHGHRDPRRTDENVAPAQLGGELQLVAEAVAAAAGDGDAQKIARLLAGNK